MKRSLLLAYTSALALALSQTSSATTTLTFDNFTGTSGGGNAQVTPAFGSFAAASSPGILVSSGAAVIGTPNIAIAWGAGSEPYEQWESSGVTNRGPVLQLDFLDTGTRPLIQFTFTPDASNAVRILYFDLDLYTGGAAPPAPRPSGAQVNWSVSGPISGVLDSDSWIRPSGNGRDPFPVTATGLPGEVLTLSFNWVSGRGNYMALDNLVIDQIPVPEPAGAALGVLGLAAAALRRRRSA